MKLYFRCYFKLLYVSLQSNIGLTLNGVILTGRATSNNWKKTVNKYSL